MALGISPQYSFFQSPEGDLFVKSQSQGGKPSTRIKRLYSSSPETLSKIANGTAKLIKLESSPECVPVEVKELKKLIRLQKQSEQLNHATIRIEKLVPH
mgnify:CR=1 FL=1